MSDHIHHYFDSRSFTHSLSSSKNPSQDANANIQIPSNHSICEHEELSEIESIGDPDYDKFRKQVIKDPDFFKQLSLSFYSKREQPIPTPNRYYSNFSTPLTLFSTSKKKPSAVYTTPVSPAIKVLQTPQAMLKKPLHMAFKTPSAQCKPVNPLQQAHAKKQKAATCLDIDTENSENVNPNCMPSSLQSVCNSGYKLPSDSSGNKSGTPKEFKIKKSNVRPITSRVVSQAASPIMKMETSRSTKSSKLQVKSPQPTMKKFLNLSKGPDQAVEKTKSVIRSPLATCKVVNRAQNYQKIRLPTNRAGSEIEKLHHAKTIKAPSPKLPLKISIPNTVDEYEYGHPSQPSSVKATLQKATTPLGNYTISPTGIRTPTGKLSVTPNRPNDAVSGTGKAQFRAARFLFQKEAKKPDQELPQEKLFESNTPLPCDNTANLRV